MGTMLGPRMAPIVAPHTTVPMADARRETGYMSAAVYRESWLALFAKPISAVPTRNTRKDEVMSASAASAAPTAPTT